MNEKNTQVYYVFVFCSVIVSLIVSLISFFVTSFTSVNLILFDADQNWYSYYGERYELLPIAVSFFFFAFPIFLYLSKKKGDIDTNSLSQTMQRLRLVAIALILTISISILVVSLSLIFYNFLTAGLTDRFVVKNLIALGVGGLLFYYYKGEWKNKWATQPHIRRLLFYFATILFIVTSAISIYYVRPHEARYRDETIKTLNNAVWTLQSISSDFKKQENKQLPSKPRNHENHKNLTYKKDSYRSLTLCLTVKNVFDTERFNTESSPYDKFPHTNPGKQCFSFVLSPDGTPNLLEKRGE